MRFARPLQVGFCFAFGSALPAGCVAGTVVSQSGHAASPAPAPSATSTRGPIIEPTLGGGGSSSPPSGSTPVPTPLPTPTNTPLPKGQTPSPTPSPAPLPSPTPTIVMTTLPPGVKIYVANHGKEGASPSVTIYAQTATGNQAPIATLAGPHTNMQQIQFPAVDTGGNLYLTDSGSSADATSGYLSYFGATGQSGNQPPSEVIGSMPNPEGVAIDGSGDVYVATEGAVVVYPPMPTAATAPLRTVTGTFTNSTAPYGIAIDASGRLYVTLSNEVEVFAAGASGDAAPIQEFDEPSDPGSELASCLGIAVDTSDDIYCANFNNSTITEYAAGASGTSVTPMVTATDPTKTSIDEPFGIFVDQSNTVYVANYGNDSVAIFAGGALASGIATRTIAGSATGLNFPYGLYVR